MSARPRRTGRPKASDLELHEDFAASEHRSYHASADGIRLVEVVQSSSSKRQKVAPKDIDDTYGDWIPVEEPHPDVADDGEVPPVMRDPEAAGKRKRYDSSVSQMLYSVYESSS